MLSLEKIDLAFNRSTPDETKLFEQFDFAVQKGEFVSVIGSNGSGKTTLLNLICGTVSPDSGHILFDHRNITKMRDYQRSSYIGRVFQDPHLGTCSELSVIENMALADNKNKPFGLRLGVNKQRISYYQELLESCHMGLENRMNAKVGNLSGGQRQALALVIANMCDIDLLILDEHTAALDPKSSETIMALTDRLVQKNHLTTLMVTHNLRFALEYGNRLVMMHEGKIVLDLDAEQKKQAELDDLLKVFNEISIECGN